MVTCSQVMNITLSINYDHNYQNYYCCCSFPSSNLSLLVSSFLIIVKNSFTSGELLAALYSCIGITWSIPLLLVYSLLRSTWLQIDSVPHCWFHLRCCIFWMWHSYSNISWIQCLLVIGIPTHWNQTNQIGLDMEYIGTSDFIIEFGITEYAYSTE